MSTLYNYNTINTAGSQEEFFDNTKLINHMILKEKAIDTIATAAKIANKSDAYITNIRDCGHFIGVQGGVVKEANFCRARFCPVCQWKRSLATYHNVKLICESIKKEYSDSRFLLLTLTQKNVFASSETLIDEIDRILYAYKKFRQFKTVKKASRGMIKTLEVTYNPERGEFHPHMHIILCVPACYFQKGNDIYISQKEYCELWKIALETSDNVSCDIRAIKSDDDIPGAVAEVCKYAVKLNSVADKGGALMLSHIMSALHGRRLFTMAGIFRKKGKELGINEKNISEFDESENPEKADNTAEKSEIVPYKWTNGTYKLLKLH